MDKTFRELRSFATTGGIIIYFIHKLYDEDNVSVIKNVFPILLIS